MRISQGEVGDTRARPCTPGSIARDRMERFPSPTPPATPPRPSTSSYSTPLISIRSSCQLYSADLYNCAASVLGEIYTLTNLCENIYSGVLVIAACMNNRRTHRGHEARRAPRASGPLCPLKCPPSKPGQERSWSSWTSGRRRPRS